MTGIENRDTDAFLDEVPGAYEPIDQVMADASDLVAVRHTLRQVVDVEGARGADGRTVAASATVLPSGV